MDFAAGWMMRWPLATQFRLGFAAALALVLGVAGAAGWIALDHQAEIKKAYETQLRTTMELAEAQASFWQLRFGIRQFMLEEGDRQQLLREQETWYGRIEEQLAAYEQTTASLDERRALTSLRAAYLRYKQARPKFFDLWQAGQKDEAMAWLALTIQPFGAQAGRLFEAQVELLHKSSERSRAQSERKARVALAGVAAMMLALLAMLAFAYAFSRQLLRPIRALEARTRRTVQEETGGVMVPSSGGNEISALVDGFQWMTERLHAHAESLRRSGERLDFLISATPAVIWSSKAAGDFDRTYVSPNVREQLGYDAAEFTDKPGFWASRIHPDDRERILAGLRAIDEASHHAHEYRFARRDGDWRWVRADMRVIRDAGGVPTELVGYWIDVTDRVQAGEERRQALERLQTALEGAKLALWDADEAGSIWLSQEWAEMLGQPKGVTWTTFDGLLAHVEPSDRECMRDVIVAVVKGQRSEFSGEYRVRSATGETLWVHFQGRVTLRTEAGWTVRMSGVARDVSERKRNEDRVKRMANRLALANNAKMDFLAIVTHELRTPLNSVLGFAGLLKDEVPGPLNEQQAAFAADILAGGLQLLKLVDAILEMSRLGIEPAQPTQELREIGGVLEDHVAAHRPTAGANRIGIALEVEPGAGRALVDLAALRRILDVLLDNAIKFNRPGGLVTMSVRRRGGWLAVAVADTGIGIPREDFEAVFRPFGQVDTRLARMHGGLGLGLALARSLAQAQGGTIEVSSEPGQGSTFTLLLPLAEAS